MESVLLFFIRFTVRLLRILPQRLAIGLITSVLRLFFMLQPRYRRIALKNLRIAFPGESDAWREDIFRASNQEYARVLIDFARLPRLTLDWVNTHVECPSLARYLEMKRENPAQGILLVTGHLGSFELLAHCVPLWGHKIAFVVRNFKLRKIDKWWTAMREANGNKVIARKGAFQEVSHYLSQGTDVAILFDQNVTRKHAVFVELFGKLAATTKTPAIVALRNKARALVCSVAYIGEDRYRVNAVECELQDLYESETLGTDEKIEKITQRLSSEYQKMIAADPAAWFWIHRRWRTRPEGEEENPYAEN